jgi:hypothetical protein
MTQPNQTTQSEGEKITSARGYGYAVGLAGEINAAISAARAEGEKVGAQRTRESCKALIEKIKISRRDGWISVEERLPETRDAVLIRVNDLGPAPFTAMGHYEGLHGWSPYYQATISHWRPLPAPPAKR